MTLLDTSLELITRGMSPVPVSFRGKKPTMGEWQKLRITRENAPQFFNGAPLNIGVMLGRLSGGTTDVDLDCAEAVATASYFLLQTGAIFGRASRRASHHIFKTKLA